MNRGFSIVEAMVIVAIIAVLVTLSYSRYKHHIAKTRQAEAKSNLGLLSALQESFLLEHGQYSFLEKVGLDNSGPSKHYCDTDRPGYELLNELGFRPNDCKALRYQYWSPRRTRKAGVMVSLKTLATANPPEYVLRADSDPKETRVYIWPDCETKDSWRVRNSDKGRVSQQFHDRQVLKGCK